MRWAAMVVLAVVLVTGCRKQEKDIEALSREAVEDEVTAVLDSLERAAASGKPDTVPVTAITQPVVHRPAPDTPVPTESKPIAEVPDSMRMSVPEEAPPVGAPKAGPTEPAIGVWVIQIGTFTDSLAAVQAADRYRQAELPAFVRRANQEGKTFFRLRIGGYDTREEARSVGEELKARYGLEYWIAPNR
jgi:cell division septation protein DedD